MISQSVNSSVITAKLSATHLKDNGLLVLVGAAAAAEGTPGMIAYGIAKAGVHHLVKSVAAANSGFPAGAKVVAVLPVTLDTPMNRQFMPDADFSKWTPLEELSGKILGWAEGSEAVASGSLLKVVTSNGKTEYSAV
ncbi:putative quinoid dihydropteridine reductase [Obelidium mucronatum]|nr:putative quinoid dihydropteridine reductase [Obelidium mucronatum]